MILTIPLLKGMELVPELPAILEKFGPYPMHELVILVDEASLKDGGTLKAKMSGHFSRVQLLSAPPAEGNLIKRLNHFFQWWATQVQGMVVSDPRAAFLWFENTNVPLKPAWLDSLQAAYLGSGKQYMGVQEKLYRWDSNREAWLPDEHHIPRSSVYWAGLAQDSTMIDFLKDSFDIELQHELWPKTYASPIMQFNWNTGNYRKDESGAIVCDDFDMFEDSDKPYPIFYGVPIQPATVLLQGCVDNSLHKLLLAE